MKSRFTSLGFFLAVPALATITQVQSAKNWSCGASGNTVTCVVNTTTTVSNGNLLAVWTFWQSASPYTAQAQDNASPPNTFYSAVGPTLQSASNTNAQIFYAKKINATTGVDQITVTFSCPSTVSACGGSPVISSAGAVVAEYSGLDQNNPLDSSTAGYSNSNAPTSILDSGNVPPANQNLLLFAGGTSDNGTASASSGWTTVQSSAGSITEYLVVSGNTTLQRATATIGSSTGNWVMQMAVFRDASWTFEGVWTPVRSGQVLDATQFPGVDIGDKVNHAVAVLPSANCTTPTSPCGGKVVIPLAPGGGCWNFATTINIPTNIPVSLEGLGVRTCLNFQPPGPSPSGNAIQINWGGNHYPAVLQNFMLLGSGSATNTVGVYIGSSSGVITDQVIIRAINIGAKNTLSTGFGIGIQTSNSAFDISIEDSAILNNNVGIQVNAGTIPIRIVNTNLSQNVSAGLLMSGAPAVAVLVGDDIELGTSTCPTCDCGVPAGITIKDNVTVTDYGTHYEDPAHDVYHYPYRYVCGAATATNATFTKFGGDFLEDDSTAFSLTSAANASGGSTVYTGTITGGGSNFYAGQTFTISGFDISANNGVFVCTGSTTTTLTCNNASGVSDTHQANAARTLSSFNSWQGDFMELVGVSVNTVGAAVTNINNSASTHSTIICDDIRNAHPTQIGSCVAGYQPVMKDESCSGNGGGCYTNLFGFRFKLADEGQCQLDGTDGRCPTQNLSSTYKNGPLCFATWNGVNTLTGILKVASCPSCGPGGVGQAYPASTVGSDNAQVSWACFGN